MTNSSVTSASTRKGLAGTNGLMVPTSDSFPGPDTCHCPGVPGEDSAKSQGQARASSWRPGLLGGAAGTKQGLRDHWDLTDGNRLGPVGEDSVVLIRTPSLSRETEIQRG